jgi:hypothetical protein
LKFGLLGADCVKAMQNLRIYNEQPNVSLFLSMDKTADKWKAGIENTIKEITLWPMIK